MMKINTKNFRAIALLVVLLTGVVLINGCMKTGGPPELQVPGIPEQTLRGMIINNTSSGTIYDVTTETLIAYGGEPFGGYTWSRANLSSMPAGTTFDPLTGIFHSSGGILLPGTHTFDMTVSDGSSTATGTFTFVVDTFEGFGPKAVFQQPQGVSSISLPDANTGYGYGASLWALGDGELFWSWYLADGELPPGMVIDQAKGVVRGKPFSSAAGNTYDFTITVKGNTGEEALTGPTYTISVPE